MSLVTCFLTPLVVLPSSRYQGGGGRMGGGQVGSGGYRTGTGCSGYLGAGWYLGCRVGTEPSLA